MIHVTDIRIGNHVMMKNASNEFEEVVIMPMHIPMMHLKPDHFYPIELTKDVLERIGMEVAFEASYYTIYALTTKDYYIRHLVPTRKKATTFSINGVDAHHIKYLHQVQNIIHIHTGKELIIKTKNQ